MVLVTTDAFPSSPTLREPIMSSRLAHLTFKQACAGCISHGEEGLEMLVAKLSQESLTNCSVRAHNDSATCVGTLRTESETVFMTNRSLVHPLGHVLYGR